jgi:hypothetical protein
MIRAIRIPMVLALGAALLLAGTVSGDGGGAKLLDASMAGIPAGAAGMFPGLQGGGVPWVLDKGDARLFTDGRLQVNVEGLVFASGPNAGRNTVPTGEAIVSCNGGSTLIASDAVPFSPEGDAMVSEQIALPASCLAPAVFFAGLTGNGPRWFAVTGM